MVAVFKIEGKKNSKTCTNRERRSWVNCLNAVVHKYTVNMMNDSAKCGDGYAGWMKSFLCSRL